MADEMWAEAGDVVLAARYTHVTPGEYDPVTGETNDTTITIDVTVILDQWRQDQIDGVTVKAGDRIAKVRANELGREPSTDGELRIEKAHGAGVIDSQLWQIKRYTTDPAGVVYDIHVRALQ